MRTGDFSRFIIERYRIFERRSIEHRPPPWTDDEILRRYKFCNVRREDDAVTKFIRSEWLKPNCCNEDLWFASLIARFFNLPAFLKRIGFPVPFNPEIIKKEAALTSESGGVKFNTAYLITTNGARGEKVDLLMRLVFEPAWARRAEFKYKAGETLKSFHEKLVTLNGIKSFLAGQIIADIKYDPKFIDAPDWDSFVAIGPGSKRGINRVFGNGKKDSMTEAEFIEMFTKLRSSVEPIIEASGVPHLHAQDLQNCLCEFDKYERVRLDEGGKVRPFKNFENQKLL